MENFKTTMRTGIHMSMREPNDYVVYINKDYTKLCFETFRQYSSLPYSIRRYGSWRFEFTLKELKEGHIRLGSTDTAFGKTISFSTGKQTINLDVKNRETAKHIVESLNLLL